MIHYLILMPGCIKEYIIVAEKILIGDPAGQIYFYKGEDLIAVIPREASVINSHFIFENKK